MHNMLTAPEGFSFIRRYENGDFVIAKTVYLSPNDRPANWLQITDTEAERLQKEKEEEERALAE